MLFRFIAAAFGLALVLEAQSFEGRTGPFYNVTIELENPGSDLDRLNAAGYNITSVNDTVATLMTTAEELLWLGADGYRLVHAERVTQVRAKSGGKGLGVYHSYATLTAELQSYALSYPSICQIESLGQSVLGREIWAMKITDKPDKEEFEPEVKYVSTMHGDEPVGMEMCLYFIDRLLKNYVTDTRIYKLVNKTEMWIVPLMNPDGLEAVSRFNNQGLDLNRNFPTWPEEFDGAIFNGGTLATAGRAPETQHIMNWSAEHSFSLAANFHTGALIANYPYDDDDQGSGVDAPAPDDALFRNLALRYSTPNEPMFNSSVPESPGGIINGSLWYEITGGMQDWNYRFLGCPELTFELSVTKIPDEELLDDLWADNEESMIALVEAAHIGIKGIVKDKNTKEALYAKVRIKGNPQPVFTDPDKGDYHRLLLPGVYTLKVTAPGYKTKKIKNVVVTTGNAVRVNVKLKLK